MPKTDSAPDSRIVFPYPDNFFDSELPKGVLSPSGISRYRSCARQFKYAYIDGKRSPPGIAAVRGRALHFGAERVHKHTIDTGIRMSLDHAVACVADKFDLEVQEVPSELQVVNNMPVGVVKDRTIENFGVYYTQAVPGIDPIGVEEPFAIKIGGVPIRGIIDLIDRVRGEYTLEDDPELPPPKIEVVSDLKSTKMRWSEQRVAHEVSLTIYAIAKNVERVRVDLLLDRKKGGEYVALRAPRTKQEKRTVTEDIEEIAYAIKQGIFPRCNPTDWVCTPRWCGYYAECRGSK